MKNKQEQKLDAELERISVSLMIYHFRKDVGPYTSITIVTNSIRSWNQMRELLDQYLFYFTTIPPASEALKLLRKLGIYGVTICDRRDAFNRQRGRIIAKGRLLKHFKEMKK
jgi:hypothetical protein